MKPTAPWRWLVSAFVVVAAAAVWSFAVASGVEASPLVAMPYGLSMMSAAALMTPAIWRLSGYIPWQPTRPLFIAANCVAGMVFAVLFTGAQALPRLGSHSFPEAVVAPFTVPAANWNLLTGAWLYLAIAGVCYSRHGDEAVRASERAQAELAVIAREAQLAALSAQVQPHFLFNALHTVGALIHVDPDRADTALDELGTLLRYALRPAGDDVSLRQEWRFTQDYLAFEGLRLGERLRVEADVDASALDALVPPFLLQPLVENAVRHGASDTADGGHVGILIRRRAAVLELRVSNSLSAHSRPGMAGSGLARLQKRLSLKYGPDRSSVTTHVDDVFTVSVALPWEAGA